MCRIESLVLMSILAVPVVALAHPTETPPALPPSVLPSIVAPTSEVVVPGPVVPPPAVPPRRLLDQPDTALVPPVAPPTVSPPGEVTAPAAVGTPYPYSVPAVPAPVAPVGPVAPVVPATPVAPAAAVIRGPTDFLAAPASPLIPLGESPRVLGTAPILSLPAVSILTPEDRRRLLAREALTRANTRRATGRYAEAVALYNQVLALAPRHPEAYLQRGLALARMGDSIAARTDLEEFQRIEPWAAGRMVDVANLLNRGVPRGNAFVNPVAIGQGYFNHALAAFRSYDYENAVAMASQAATRIPSDARVQGLMVQTMVALKDYPAAAQQARTAAGAGTVIDTPTLYSFYNNNMGLYTSHLRSLEAYVRQYPLLADSRFLLGYQYLVLGHFGPAREQFAAAVQLATSDRLASNMLAEADNRERTTVATRPGTVTW